MKLYNRDCMEGMAEYPDNYFDLAIVDPPYGLERFKSGGSHVNKHGDENKDWNNVKPSKEYFEELMRVSNHQIIWGANNFELPTSEYFVVWKKGNALDFSFAMVEQAWTNVKKPAKIFELLHSQSGEQRMHPTQKPVKLYSWLLQNYSSPEHKILDTHLGSASHAIAWHYFQKGGEFVGYELDSEYFEKSIARIKQETAQISMF